MLCVRLVFCLYAEDAGIFGQHEMFGDYLKFETITLCPICKKGIVKEMLTNEEIEWLNNYHQIVYEKLSPNLNEEEKVWLQEATASI